jgi:putative membrane protein
MNRLAPSRIALTAAALALGFAVGAAAAADGKLARSDARFLQKAATDGLAEVELGRLAQQKAMRDEVKQFATRMVEDHGKANEELKAVAATNGVALPAAPDKAHEKLMRKLEKLTGGDFDRAYMKAMVKDHRKDIDEFREHARSKRDDDARAFAAKTLPVLQGHLDAALATNDIVQAPKRTGKRETGSSKP